MCLAPRNQGYGRPSTMAPNCTCTHILWGFCRNMKPDLVGLLWGSSVFWKGPQVPSILLASLPCFKSSPREYSPASTAWVSLNIYAVVLYMSIACFQGPVPIKCPLRSHWNHTSKVFSLTSSFSQETVNLEAGFLLKVNLAQVTSKLETLFISDIGHKHHEKAFHTPIQYTVRLRFIYILYSLKAVNGFALSHSQ